MNEYEVHGSTRQRKLVTKKINGLIEAEFPGFGDSRLREISYGRDYSMTVGFPGIDQDDSHEYTQVIHRVDAQADNNGGIDAQIGIEVRWAFLPEEVDFNDQERLALANCYGGYDEIQDDQGVEVPSQQEIVDILDSYQVACMAVRGLKYRVSSDADIDISEERFYIVDGDSYGYVSSDFLRSNGDDGYYGGQDLPIKHEQIKDDYLLDARFNLLIEETGLLDSADMQELLPYSEKMAGLLYAVRCIRRKKPWIERGLMLD